MSFLIHKKKCSLFKENLGGQPFHCPTYSRIHLVRARVFVFDCYYNKATWIYRIWVFFVRPILYFTQVKKNMS